MAKWQYKMTKHRINGQSLPQSEEIIDCDERGGCLVHDLHGENMTELQKALDQEGAQEWELVQCHYHGRRLLCLWKKEVR